GEAADSMHQVLSRNPWMVPVRILIADDHEIVRRGVRSLLKSRSDWSVCGEAVDGVDAVRKAKELKPDVIVLDISMPQLNGLDAARQIRKEVPQSEILILSQHGAAEMERTALSAGARAYVSKTDVSRDLLAAVEALSQHRAPRTLREPAFAAAAPGPEQLPTAPTVVKTDSLVADARERLATIVDSSSDAIISKKLDGIVHSWNASAERIFGYTAQEMIGQPITTIIPPELHEEEAMILNRLRSGQRIDQFETVRVAKSGKRITVSLTISPVRDSAGIIVGASKIARDITEHKRVQELLRAAHDELEARVQERTTELERRTAQVSAQAELLDLANDAILVRSLDDRITYWNRGSARLYGWTKEEVLGKHPQDILRTEFPEPFENIKAQLLREGS